jgi:uncharacterized damage-inducible protein DinB
MSEKKRLLRWFDQARAEMRSTLEGIDTEQEIYPGWRIRENIAHITGWEEVTLKSLQAFLEGGEPYLLPVQGIDQHNADLIAARQSMTYEEALHEWEETREALISAIAELSEGDLETRITFPWGPRGTLRDMLAIIADHEGDHARGLSELK